MRHFTMKYGLKLGKQIESIPERTMEALLAYPWPGNVRELENVMERAVILTRGSRLAPGEWLPKAATVAASEPAGVKPLAEHEREYISSVLELTGWRVAGEKGAAKALGLRPSTLQARMKKLGIVRRQVL